MTAASGNGARRSEEAARDAEGPFDEIGRALAGAPRPRSVRLSRQGKTAASILTIALLGALAGYLVTLGITRRTLPGQPAQPVHFPVNAIPIGSVAVIAAVLLNVMARQKQLLAEGEVAIALVTKQWRTHRGSAIGYEFTTPLGEHLSHGASDGSRRLVTGMTVPVFYDLQKPKRQLALCASFYEVVLSGMQ